MRTALDIKDIPARWYNIVPDLDFAMAPPMSPSGFPLGRHDLENLAASDIIKQELETNSREVAIPKDVADLYAEWRPTPLYRAGKLEKALGTPARIFYKHEGSNASGGHEMNTAIPQAYFAKLERGVTSIVTATSNGEWGVSLTVACNYFGLKCKVYMVRSSYEEAAYGRYAMEILGAEVVPSPNESTRVGKKILAQNPNSPGSLGIALSEAFEEALVKDDTKFSWGTVMNHVLLHQTVIGLETREQLKHVDVKPDVLIGSVAGGSGFGGLITPFYRGRSKDLKMIAVETASAPSLTKGEYAYDYGDSEGLSPMLKMYTLGHSFMPGSIRAGAMRYHGMSPLISALYREKEIEARCYTQAEALEAGITFARAEGRIPSAESSYAIKAAIDEANACKEKHESKNIVFLLDANSNYDLGSFEQFVRGALKDQPLLADDLQLSLQRLPKVAG